MKLLHTICALLIACCVLHAQVQRTDTIKGKIYYRYTVERGVGLYQVSKRFGTTQEQLLKLNPEIRRSGLSYGQTIIVPALDMTAAAEVTELSTDPESAIVTATEVTDSISLNLEERKQKIYPNRRMRNEGMAPELMPMAEQDTLDSDSAALDTIRMAVMLPLHANTIKRTAIMDRFLDFYIGTLIAIYEAQNEGKFIELHTYDVGKTVQGVEKCATDSTWHAMDAIIGPAYGQQVEAMAKYALRDSTWLIAPFASEIESVQTNPYLLKFNPSSKDEADALAEYLLLSDDSVNCVVIKAREGENIPKSIQYLHTALDANGIPTTSTTIRNLLVDSAENAFVPGVENIVIFNTEKYNNLQAVIPHLLKLQKQYPITLYSRYTWQTEDIALPQIYTSIFHEATEESIKAYKAIYEQYFSTPAAEHPRYDLLGYDLTKHLLALLPINDPLQLEEMWEGIQTRIMYQHPEEGSGYVNQEINIIRKPNLEEEPSL